MKRDQVHWFHECVSLLVGLVVRKARAEDRNTLPPRAQPRVPARAVPALPAERQGPVRVRPSESAELWCVALGLLSLWCVSLCFRARADHACGWPHRIALVLVHAQVQGAPAGLEGFPVDLSSLDCLLYSNRTASCLPRQGVMDRSESRPDASLGDGPDDRAPVYRH